MVHRIIHGYTGYINLVPRALFPGLGGGAGKGPGIVRPIRHFDWLIDLGNSCKKMAPPPKPGKSALGTRLMLVL